MAEEVQVEKSASELASVKAWTKRIKGAKKRWQADFKRMRANCDFAAGFQWLGQATLDDDKYIANMTLRFVNQKVSQLYARDPKAIARRRKRLDYQIWDGKIESLQQALVGAQQADVASMALVMDYTEGRRRRDMVDKVGRTLEILYQYMCDTQSPPFKEQMKSLVRRVVTTGVGYVRLNFERDFDTPIGHDATSIVDLVRQSKELFRELADGEITDSSPKVQELKDLIAAIEACQQGGDLQDVRERLVFDFPPPTSVIVDPRCRNIRGFLGAQWVVQEYFLPLSEVNEFFETNISAASDELVRYNPTGEAQERQQVSLEEPGQQFVCLFEVFDQRTKSTFFLVDGYKGFVQAPAPVYPSLPGFWPIFVLTFNDIETEPSAKSTIFPPSDVQLVKAPQKEWNRSRNGLRGHRRQNAPKYVTGKGWLTDADREKLRNAEPGEVIELEGVPPGSDVGKMLAPFQHSPVDPALYDSTVLQQDMLFVIGTQEATQPASSKATATAATINEQSRQLTASSNVDDLDDFLSLLAESAGQILLKECTPETVIRVVGPGALWPQPQEVGDFANELFLDVVAASSGRPNKALEVSNFQQLAPILIQAGANPHFIVREALKRLDDRLEPDEAFASGPAPMPSMPPQMQQQPARGTNAPKPNGQQMPPATVPTPIQHPRLP